MQRVVWMLIVSLILACLPFATASAWGDKEPTAIIVDDETGEPIKGAIALAQWIKYSWLRRWMEGGTYYLTKDKETVSDEQGKIYIKGYWNKISFSGKPHLTVYKPGYALWNSERGPIYYNEPKALSRTYKVVRLVKFEKAAEEWKEIASTEFEKKRPRDLQFRFLIKCFESELKKSAITMDEVFARHEDRLRAQENAQAWRENEESR